MHANAQTLPPTAKGLVPRLPLYLVLIVFMLGVRSMLRRARLVSYYNVTSWRYSLCTCPTCTRVRFRSRARARVRAFISTRVSLSANNQATPWNVLATNLGAACRLIVVGGSILYS